MSYIQGGQICPSCHQSRCPYCNPKGPSLSCGPYHRVPDGGCYKHDCPGRTPSYPPPQPEYRTYQHLPPQNPPREVRVTVRQEPQPGFEQVFYPGGLVITENRIPYSPVPGTVVYPSPQPRAFVYAQPPAPIYPPARIVFRF